MVREDEASETARRWAWWIPGVAMGMADILTDAFGHGAQLLHLTFGLAGGIAWQLLYRRDLVSRLSLITAVWGVAAVVALVAGAPVKPTGQLVSDGLGVFGVLLGLVQTEQWLRWRDRRDDAVSARVVVPDEAGAHR